MSGNDAGVVLEIVEPHVELFTLSKEIMDAPRRLEWCGRVCYKSENRITKGSAEKFIRKIRKMGHESVLEHFSITAKFIGSRSMSQQLERHRIGSYCQESQRYCNYGKRNTLKVILPPSIGGERQYRNGQMFSFDSGGNVRFQLADGAMAETPVEEGSSLWIWAMSCLTSYKAYSDLLALNVRPEDAREVLPNATKTEVVTTYNLRQWRHFFTMRCDKHAQWQIRGMATSLLAVFNDLCPSVFEDLAQMFLRRGSKDGQ